VSRAAPQLRVISGGSEEPTDDGLVRAFLSGDTGAFGELIGRHQEAVFRVARRFTHTSEDARDLSQRVFLQAFEAAERTLQRLEAQAIPFRAWLLRIALNLGMNQQRDSAKWRHTASLSSLEREQGAPTAAEALQRAQEEALTRRAVLELPERQREVFLLRIDGGLSFGDVAQTLEISEGNARSHFHHALRRLKAEVAKLSTPGGAS